LFRVGGGGKRSFDSRLNVTREHMGLICGIYRTRAGLGVTYSHEATLQAVRDQLFV
jgi:hypothetical protein